ncbi:DUF2062 domain-containing protein [Actibacterium sp. 188UL27-1]|uniref:DUF2062 domain-containing protein n=1 Tax=Actibacterium sp. 188UL27-1 TaxID=2786961 RepID=UPI00195C7DE5|nr:DUF2062 domain-containing protein [Actibacterium sp. 188UL27-1]MBM7067095.1 DUF2062 domain-containing protein [Actibacterium sp. 188UL27-1]
MVFKRRDKRSWGRLCIETLWPRGGWGRAAQYIRHRVRRLPDSPERIARGIFIGVFTTFTPLYGLHFLVAAIIAKILRGNVLAAILATFFSNPITIIPIGAISLGTGHFLLGTKPARETGKTVGERFLEAGADLWHNFKAVFTAKQAHWTGLQDFYTEVFVPYTIGGLAPGVIAGVVAYYLSLPIIAAYQNRRRGMLQDKLTRLGPAAAKKPGAAE